jgi:CelD/BcsL family acetyltransferase involved in cellulose biosynthesis
VKYRLDILRAPDALFALRDEWDALYQATSPKNPFLGPDWTLACWRRVGQGSSPFVLAAREGSALVGLAALRLDRAAGFRVLRFLADGRSDYLGFLTAPGHPDAEQTLLEELRMLAGEWDLAVLRQLTHDHSALFHRPIPKGLKARGIVGTVAPYLAFSGDWQELCASGPGWLKRLGKAARTFQKKGGTWERVPPEDAPNRVDEVAAVERASWKGRRAAARFQPGRGQELLRELLSTLGPRGEMELWLAYMDGRPVAYNVNLTPEGRVWIYQGAYHEEYRKYSVGAILDCLSIERGWQAGAREYDYLCGDEPYKLERTDALREVRYLALFPNSPRGWTAYGALIAPRWRLKRVPGAKAALDRWVQLRNDPASLLAGFGRARAGAS